MDTINIKKKKHQTTQFKKDREPEEAFFQRRPTDG